MSIDRTTPAAAVNAISATQEMRTRSLNQEESKPSVNGTAGDDKTRVKLSGLVQQMQTDDSHDIDYARVATLRAALDAGELPLEPVQIARTLVMDIFQFNR